MMLTCVNGLAPYPRAKTDAGARRLSAACGTTTKNAAGDTANAEKKILHLWRLPAITFGCGARNAYASRRGED
jgi:hypothetical protein